MGKIREGQMASKINKLIGVGQAVSEIGVRSLECFHWRVRLNKTTERFEVRSS